MPPAAQKARPLQVEAYLAMRRSRWSFEDLPVPMRLWWWMFLVFGFLFVARVFADDRRDLTSIAVATAWASVVVGAFGVRRGLPESVCGFLVVFGNVVLIARYLAAWVGLLWLFLGGTP